jgi:hypothetical protein
MSQQEWDALTTSEQAFMINSYELRYVALGDSQTEGLGDGDDTSFRMPHKKPPGAELTEDQ